MSLLANLGRAFAKSDSGDFIPHVGMDRIGSGIVEKQEELGWGESAIEQLSRDLRRAFPETKGFSSRNLRNMKHLFSTYANTTIWQQAVAKLPESAIVEKLRQLVAEVPWGHNLLILNKLSEPRERVIHHASVSSSKSAGYSPAWHSRVAGTGLLTLPVCQRLQSS